MSEWRWWQGALAISGFVLGVVNLGVGGWHWARGGAWFKVRADIQRNGNDPRDWIVARVESRSRAEFRIRDIEVRPVRRVRSRVVRWSMSDGDDPSVVWLMRHNEGLPWLILPHDRHEGSIAVPGVRDAIKAIEGRPVRVRVYARTGAHRWRKSNIVQI